MATPDNPWLHIRLEDYRGHMGHPRVGQLAMLRDAFADALRAAKPTSVLMLGCTDGNGLDCIDPRVTRRVTAVDINERFLARLRESHGAGEVELTAVCGDAMQLRYPERAFDLIYAALLFEYLDWEALLPTLADALTMDGRLSVVVQVPSATEPAVSATDFSSLLSLEAIFAFVRPVQLCSVASRCGLEVAYTGVRTGASTKEFACIDFRRTPVRQDDGGGAPGPLISAASALTERAGFTLLDARPAAAFRAGHLRGALLADLEGALSQCDMALAPSVGGRHPLPSPVRWQSQCAHWGLRRNERIVVYDDAGGSNAAARAWWMLRASGYVNTCVLDGGMTTARAAGWDVDAGEGTNNAPLGGDSEVQPWQRPVVDAPMVDLVRQLDTWRVIDVRAPERWRGEVETRDPVAGRIPGSINMPWQLNLRSDGTFRSAEELRMLYREQLGDVAPHRVVVHCGSGVTACHTLLALEVAGLRGAALYVGSWSEWCRGAWPIARGPGGEGKS
ncbi:MAG: rhodanese-like domain-containing protein [Gemmatimonadota bacterium]|nr:rhodanese-like domain-containing protein [Gemmatimonadota bacterium]